MKYGLSQSCPQLGPPTVTGYVGVVRCCDIADQCYSVCGDRGQVSQNRQLPTRTCIDVNRANQSEAQIECEAHGLRLCPSEVVASGACCRTGCLMDKYNTWVRFSAGARRLSHSLEDDPSTISCDYVGRKCVTLGCKALADARLANRRPPQRVRVKPICGSLSTGNYLGLYYMVRAFAEEAGLEYVLWPPCNRSDPIDMDSLMTWLPQQGGRHNQRMPTPSPTDLFTCRSVMRATPERPTGIIYVYDSPLNWPGLAPLVRTEIREAVGMWLTSQPIGIQQLAVRWSEEAVVHIRCGDLFNYGGSMYGFLRMNSYMRVLQGVRSVGIVTASLNPAACDPQRLRLPGHCNTGRLHMREGDCKWQSLCSAYILKLADHLRNGVANLSVNIYDGDSIMQTLSRLTLAQRTVCNPSTFCFWPTVASKDGLLPITPLFPWARQVAQQLDTVELINDTYITYNDIKQQRLYTPERLIQKLYD